MIYSDTLNHASLVDGCRLSKATIRVFPHRDLDELGAMLEADRGIYRRALIVVEGVFSMDGDVFPLEGLVDVAQRFGAWTYVDDAHGTGVLGAQGSGTIEQCGVTGRIDVVVGTLGKSLGTSGAWVAGSQHAHRVPHQPRAVLHLHHREHRRRWRRRRSRRCGCPR